MQADLSIHFTGPLAWSASEGAPSVFEDPLTWKCGLYLWTVETPAGEFVYYVGETGRTFSIRLFEHLKEHLAGAYHVYDPEPFHMGEKVELWPGLYGRPRSQAVPELLARYAELAGPIDALARTYRFFLAPLEGDRRLRERAEAAIAGALAASQRNFQDAGIRYRPRYVHEDPLVLEITCDRVLLDLPSVIAL